jgi:hypothetical protein
MQRNAYVTSLKGARPDLGSKLNLIIALKELNALDIVKKVNDYLRLINV